MTDASRRALDRVSFDRLRSTAFELVSIPSPTGDSAQVAREFKNRLESLGLQVQVVDELPGTQVVLGRLPGSGGGPTLELNGHLDTVPLVHPAPEIRDGKLFGRGAFDMKGQMAAFLEALEALTSSGTRLAGDVLITAHGLHEFPGEYEHSEDRLRLLQRGVVGDACFVPDSLEGSADALPIVYGGMGVFTITVTRPGEVTHELEAEAGTPNPIAYAAALTQALLAENERFSHVPHALLGPDTYHVGAISGGDYFNRFANTAVLQGTRRYAPGTTPQQAKAELGDVVERVLAGSGLTAATEFKGSTPYEVEENHRFVELVRGAHQAVTGQPLPVVGVRCAGDVTMLGTVGRIPALNHCAKGGGHHADVEWIDLDDLLRLTKLITLTCIDYCGLAATTSDEVGGRTE